MDKQSFEDLVKHDPPLPIHKGVIPVVSFLWNAKICKAIHPLKLLAVYGGMGALYKSLPKDQKWARGGLMTLGMLPILGFSLFTTAAVLMFSKNRKASFESAQTLLLERLKSKRAIRKQDKYDVFLPVQEAKIGVIFFPGALVSHTAYAGIAAALSDKGILVVVLSLEPVRFIADTETNRKIAQNALKDLSDNHDLKHVSVKEKEAFENQLPEDTKFVSVEGGNHAQFAHYGPQSMDGEATISMEEQQKNLVETTASFLSK